MDEKQIIQTESDLMPNVYAKRPTVLVEGKGALVWDINGKEYIDCTSSYGVSLIGHSHPKVVKAIQAQAEKLISCHSSFYNDKRSELLQKLVQITPKGLDKVFLSNSGSESIECAIKLARKSMEKPEIIAVIGAYHGKTMGALSATWNKKYRYPFKPLVPEFKHVQPDNLKAIKEAITDRTAGILVEPIRGEGGIRVPPDDFLPGLREICNSRNILLILDEVQTGFGRTGKNFACEHWNVTPDIMCIAKPIAGGLPIGATIAKENVMNSLKVGEHTSTFGGSPIVCAAACAAIDLFQEENFPRRAANLGAYFKAKLEELMSKRTILKEIRGLGLMIGAETRFEVRNILSKSMERGVLILNAGRNVLRFLPPFVIEKKHINTVIKVLDIVLEEEENERQLSSPSK